MDCSLKPADHALRTLWHAHRRRSGIALRDLLTGRTDLPDGMVVADVERFYRGEPALLCATDAEFITALWARRPERPLPRKPKSKVEKVVFSDALRLELRGHFLRVGLSVEAFFKCIETPPTRLSARILYRWLSDEPPGHVRKDHLEAVLTAWRRLPAAHGRVRRIHLIPFGAESATLSD